MSKGFFLKIVTFQPSEENCLCRLRERTASRVREIRICPLHSAKMLLKLFFSVLGDDLAYPIALVQGAP